MGNERLIARGRLEELKENRFSLLVEIRTLTEDIRRKIPTPVLDCNDISIIKTKEAKVLLQRLSVLQDELTSVIDMIVRIIEEYGFEE